MNHVGRRYHWAIRALISLLVAVLPGSVLAASDSYTLFESGPVRPLALSPNGENLFVTNIPDGRLEIFTVGSTGLSHTASVPVGLEPVAVAARSNSEVWVVNHLSDSVSVVDVAADPPRVTRTLLVGDEPRDIVFAGAEFDLAFVTAAHRGQNRPGDPQFFEPGVGRADVWVFDAAHLGESPGGTPRTIVQLFGDTPRALARSRDGRSVYAAVFHSGNQTTSVAGFLICPGGESAEPCVPARERFPNRVAPGGLPGPLTSTDGAPRPETALIVRVNPATGAFEDELGRDWSPMLSFSLPDYDVFRIDATLDTPAEVARFSGVGTILFNMEVNPVDGFLYVSNTEAHNEIRFEPNLRGHLHETRITAINPRAGAVLPHHLNAHIDYDIVPSDAGTADQSLATPLGMVVTSDGKTVYLAAYGSSAIGVFAASDLEDTSRTARARKILRLDGGGPAGIALDERLGRLYVLTRFDNSVRAIDLEASSQTQAIPLHSPEPASVIEGRPLLYDARSSSSNGEVSCASCHVFGHFDSLAWDLGDPAGAAITGTLPRIDNETFSVASEELTFHPMKGPMTTQTLRGMTGQGPMHWRGDRFGADYTDAIAAFHTFNPAFMTLMGRDAPLSAEEMQRLTDFAMQISMPPNPVRNLDDSLTPVQQIGKDKYFSESNGHCFQCHRLEPEAGFFGSSGFYTTRRIQPMSVAQLRNVYEKIGYFSIGLIPTFEADPDFGPQVRGYGTSNAGDIPLRPSPVIDFQEQLSFVLAYPSNLAPIVGQQCTVDSTSGSGAMQRVNLLIEEAAAGKSDLVVNGVRAGEPRGWLYRTDGTFQGDRVTDTPSTALSLIETASPDEPLTFTSVPPGSGRRIAIDRDEDGYLDTDERDSGSDAADAADNPRGGCPGDCNGGGAVTVDELVRGVAIGRHQLPVARCYRFDANADSVVNSSEVLQALSAALDGCSVASAP